MLFFILEWKNKKIWYLKEEVYSKIMFNTTFISLFLSLFLVLKYLKIANLITITILVLLLLASRFPVIKKKE